MVMECARDFKIVSFNHPTILLEHTTVPPFQMGKQRSRPLYSSVPGSGLRVGCVRL